MNKKIILCLISLLLICSAVFAADPHVVEVGTVNTNDVEEDKYFTSLSEALGYACDINKAGDNVVVEITSDLSVSDQIWVLVDNHSVTINGNGNTITASFSYSGNPSFKKYVLCFDAKTTDEPCKLTINNLSIVVGNNFRGGLEFYTDTNGSNLKTGECILNKVTIKANRTSCPKNENKEEKYSTLLQNNYASVTLKGECTFESDNYCWALIDIDNKQGDAAFIIDKDAKVKFVDNRIFAKKSTEPMIKLDEQFRGYKMEVSIPESYGMHRTQLGFDFHDWVFFAKDNTISANCSCSECVYHFHPVSVSMRVLPNEVTLTPIFVPDFADNQNVKWVSLDKKVATVDKNGVVKAKGEGSVKIIATSDDNSSKTAICVVEVKK